MSILLPVKPALLQVLTVIHSALLAIWSLPKLPSTNATDLESCDLNSVLYKLEGAAGGVAVRGTDFFSRREEEEQTWRGAAGGCPPERSPDALPAEARAGKVKRHKLRRAVATF